MCSCGNSEIHKIARRHTADGYPVDIFSDGTVRAGHWFGLRGLGTPRSRFAKERRAKAAFLMMGAFELYDLEEIPGLVKVAEKTLSHAYISDAHRRAHVAWLYQSKSPA
jgi:hypothetical protein